MKTVRHFTATGFVVDQDRVLLHWHPKVKAWLPPGGHIEENEDPVQAVLREIWEESGVEAEVVPTSSRLNLEYPTQVDAPFTIMIEDIDDPVAGFHQHIDMIYFCRLTDSDGPLHDGWHWINQNQLANEEKLRNENDDLQAPPEDVRRLARHAFQIVNSSSTR